MSLSLETDLVRVVGTVVDAVLEAADPAGLLKDSLSLEESFMVTGAQQLALHDEGRLYLIAIGKAAPSLAAAAVEILGVHLSGGIAAVPEGAEVDLPPSIQVFETAHPLPDERSLQAGAAALELLADCQPEDRVLALISGGGSAMFEHLRPGVELEELRRLNKDLLRSGTPIDAINQVRQTLSLLKGGGLARLASPAPVLALVLSDVVGDSIAAVASGPTVLEPSNPAVARAVLEEYDLWQGLSADLQAAVLHRPSTGPPIYRPINVLLGNNRVVLDAAKEVLEELGFEPDVMTSTMEGEARAVGRQLASDLLQREAGTALLAGGETTVVVTGKGTGGRNTEMALAAAIRLDGEDDVAALTLATDGRDGPTDAAGAVVTGATAAAIRTAGLDPVECLADNDSYSALEKADALIRTGLTGSNLNDLALGLAFPGRS